MKRFLTVITTLAFCLLAEARAVPGIEIQENDVTVSGGIKTDAVFLNFLKVAAPKAVSGMNPGGAVGGFVQIDFTETWGLRPEINLNYKQNVFSWEVNSGRMTSMGIEIPIYVTAGWTVAGTHRAYVGLGPYTEFLYYARWEVGDRKADMLKQNEAGEPMIQDSQSGFGALLGYKFGCGLSIEASYRICYYNILQPNTSQGVSLFPQTIGFGLAYNFGKR